LQVLLNKNLAEALEELAEAKCWWNELNVGISISDRLYAMEKNQKEDKFHMNCLNLLFKII